MPPIVSALGLFYFSKAHTLFNLTFWKSDFLLVKFLNLCPFVICKREKDWVHSWYTFFFRLHNCSDYTIRILKICDHLWDYILQVNAVMCLWYFYYCVPPKTEWDYFCSFYHHWNKNNSYPIYIIDWLRLFLIYFICRCKNSIRIY